MRFLSLNEEASYMFTLIIRQIIEMGSRINNQRQLNLYEVIIVYLYFFFMVGAYYFMGFFFFLLISQDRLYTCWFCFLAIASLERTSLAGMVQIDRQIIRFRCLVELPQLDRCLPLCLPPLGYYLQPKIHCLYIYKRYRSRLPHLAIVRGKKEEPHGTKWSL